MQQPATDLELLRAYEPILKFTRGERFFPCDADTYVRECSLWALRPRRQPVCVAHEGELTLDSLADPDDENRDALFYLQYIEPLNIAELASFQFKERLITKDPEHDFHAGRGRLARVGYLSRFVDALFTLSLLARGRVTGDTAASAIITYEESLAASPIYRYYGRVVRERGWIILQYWFFYAFNNWRSGFFGANDHEADWEQITIYLHKEEGQLVPEWVAYAAHDYTGDNLRRRWDDPELEITGNHPVVYVGAGSHASYFSVGEYITEVELAFMRPLTNFLENLRRMRDRLFRQDGIGGVDDEGGSFSVLHVPFVDYARGDGKSIGPDQSMQWETPVLLDESQPWVIQYRGLWGLFANDPVAGENAPAGPRYNRDGSIRRAWYDPLGWCGLDKVLPPPSALAQARKRIGELEDECSRLDATIDTKSLELVNLGVETQAIRDLPHMRSQRSEHQAKIKALSDEVNSMRRQRVETQSMIKALHRHAARLQSGEKGPLRAHIQRVHHKETPVESQISRAAEAWAAISIGLLLIGIIAIILFAGRVPFYAVGIFLLVVFLIEAGVRGRLNEFISIISGSLAVVAAGILLWEFFWWILIIAVLVTGGYIIWENLRELWV
jgi:hypothetical protein